MAESYMHTLPLVLGFLGDGLSKPYHWGNIFVHDIEFCDQVVL